MFSGSLPDNSRQFKASISNFVNSLPEEAADLWDSFKATIGSHREAGEISGGFFILESQSNAQKASASSRVGHGILGAVKTAAAGAFAYYAWIPLQIIMAIIGTAVLIGGLLKGKPEMIKKGLFVAFSPTFFVGIILKSAYHDFKLTAAGKG